MVESEKGSKAAKPSKTMVIRLTERNGRVHLESMSNRKCEAIKPVLDAKLADDPNRECYLAASLDVL